MPCVVQVDLELAKLLHHGLELGVVGGPDVVLEMLDLHAEFGAPDLDGREPLLCGVDVVPDLAGLLLVRGERPGLLGMGLLFQDERLTLPLEDRDAPADLFFGGRDGGFELPELVGDLADLGLAFPEPFRQVRPVRARAARPFSAAACFSWNAVTAMRTSVIPVRAFSRLLALRGKLALEALDAGLGAAVAVLEVLEHGGGTLDLRAELCPPGGAFSALRSERVDPRHRCVPFPP